MKKLTLYCSLILLLPCSLFARIGPTHNGHSSGANTASEQVTFRENCSNAVSQIDQEINNVRARLTTGGDLWWDGSDGRYIVPKPPPGVPEVSSIYAGAVWLGGKDPGGGLKVAAQSYGRNEGEFDFYPGPLGVGDPNYPDGPINDPKHGRTGLDTCANWDKFFVVKGENISEHVAKWELAKSQGVQELDVADIPADILGWPARGNMHFEDIHKFQLPNTEQGLAGFWNQDPLDGTYDPELGDYPMIEIRGCLEEEPKSPPDEMTFWIYNDAGNAHRESGSSTAIQMEVQVQAFAYATNDDINSMTFQRYKLINRAVERLDSTYFGIWLDADLGCDTDDYVGCDVSRSLAYVYNADAVDGTTGCSCDSGAATYCDEVPILGLDYFRGPTAPVYDSITNDIIGVEELGMSSFVYFNRGSAVPTPAPGTTDPQTAEEYYNYLSGKWRDGTPFTLGGDAYQSSDEAIPYAFIDPPNQAGGWSMCQEGLPVGDRRTVQASGPFTLLPGAVNELIVGAVWVPDQVYPCPSITRLQKADDVAQALFDNCFNITRGPDAPDVDWVELDQEIIAVFTNDTLRSNNAFEEYTEIGLNIPEQADDSLYRFEGYKLYQLSGPSVSLADVDDPEKVRLVYQVDKKNDVSKIFNWEGLNNADGETPTTEIYYEPKLKVDGNNKGIRHTFKITEDQFAEGNRRLINHKKYYFAAIAYAYNNYKQFDPYGAGDQGQQTPYLEGDRNIGDGDNAFYTVIPRKILDRDLMSEYGDGAIVTRIDGQGTGTDNFLDIADETRMEIEALIRDDNTDDFSNEVTYKAGFGPIDVSIFNPLEVVDGEYELTFVDSFMMNDQLDAPVLWTLRNLSDPAAPVITADKPIEELNEQIIKEYGFSITIGQVSEPGSDPFNDPTNGVIGYTEEYLNEDATPWLFGFPDGLTIPTGNNFTDINLYDYLATTNPVDQDYDEDPNQALSTIGNGFFVPYYLCNWRQKENGAPYLSPAWKNSGNQNTVVRNRTSLEDLNNVDIVFTKDKSLWSRCVIVETASPDHADIISATPADDYIVGDAKMFDLRQSPSVSKEAGPDGLPLPDANPAAGEEVGLGWFPGYAIDVETGQRLNVYFGENSAFNADLAGSSGNGADMMFNPSSEFYIPSADGAADATLLNYPAGGQHFIYVTNQPYDACALELNRFSETGIPKIASLDKITWAGFVALAPSASMLSYADGLIPEDVTVKLRVNNPYKVAIGTNDFNGYPTYRFSVKTKQATALDDVGLDHALQSINVVPNPYYGFSQYEDSELETIVKITNLPAKCNVNIYTLEGKFVRNYQRNELGDVPIGSNRAIERGQVNPDLEWDLKNFKGIPIASGVYLIHVSAPGLGERTLKWFGVNRQFDPSRL